MTTLDPNKTVWQRLNDRLLEVMDRKEADELTAHLHPYVVAEKSAARRTAPLDAA